ncbi:MAG: type II toxin-antitoxin system VapC family toxin [Planctomycetaceae bacterium]
MIFVDTWAWIALADHNDQFHAAARTQHQENLKQRQRYVTSDFVLTEFINYLYSAAPAAQAQAVVDSTFAKVDGGLIELVHVSAAQFRRAWALRRKYGDKPDISFIDFTSMVVMQDLGITHVFTGDAHFQQVGLGFQLVP